MIATEELVIDGEVVEPRSAETVQHNETQALITARDVIYDADAEQRVLFLTERKGKMYKVAHIFGPLKDEAVLEYERRRNQKLSDADADESDDQDATAVSSKGFKAAVHYWNATQATAEGYAGKVSDRDKAYAVGQLFGVEFQQLPSAEGDELCPEDDDENSAYVLRCLFDGRECYLSATLRPPTSDEISEFESLMARALLVQGTRFGQRDQRIPAKSKRLGEMFDQMKVSVEGYARRVPLHHKTAFALRHLRAEQKPITGK
jgi:hypothetical protein